MRYALWAAASYNILWGTLVVCFPALTYHWAGMKQLDYPELWQCIGMVVGVYGVAFGVAGWDPLRHWPVVLAGLMGKVLGPIGFVSAAMHGRLPWKMGWTILANDVIWWLPFGLILAAAYHALLDVRRTASPEVQRMALRSRTQQGDTLLGMSEKWPLLLVFLRHGGCTFCRETLADLAKQRQEVESSDARIVLIHMMTDRQAEKLFSHYGLGDVARVNDPNQNLYRAFGLIRGGLGRLFGPRVWWRTFWAAVLHGHVIGPPVGDVFQMPGVFLVYRGEVLRSYLHQTIADRPNYAGFVSLPAAG